MLDQQEGRTWQVQWNPDPAKRFVVPIIDVLASPSPSEVGDDPPRSPLQTRDATRRPTKPVFGEAGHENETWEQFETRQDAYLEDLTAYKVREAFAAEQAKEKRPVARPSTASPKKGNPPNAKD